MDKDMIISQLNSEIECLNSKIEYLNSEIECQKKIYYLLLKQIGIIETVMVIKRCYIMNKSHMSRKEKSKFFAHMAKLRNEYLLYYYTIKALDKKFQK